VLIRNSVLPVLAISFLSVACSNVFADDSAIRFVAWSRQDEARRLPVDNSAMFTAANRKVSIALDVLAESGDKSTLAGMMVTVVDGAGKAREFTANDAGVVTIDEVTEGPHAIVASNDEAHGSSLFVFQEQKEDAIEADLVEAKPARMTMLRVSGDGLIPIINEYLTDNDASPFADDELDSSVATGASFGYQVELGPNGELNGQVITVGAGNRSLAGTTVVILKDGQAVARDVTTADGRFSMQGVRAGVHGLVAAGPAGYTAFAFEAIAGDAITKQSSSSEFRFVSTASMAAKNLPVVLIPPKMVPAVLESIRNYYPASAGTTGQNSVAGAAAGAANAATSALASSASSVASSAGNASMGGSPMSQPQTSGSFGGASGGGLGGGGGFGGGLGGLGSLGAIGAVAAGTSNNDNSPGVVISPSSAK
jgi:hypothetical protein